VDSAKFQEANQAYEAGDYRTAAKVFLAAAGGGSVGNGSAYHMAGNSLMRLRRHSDAVTVYGHALRDETYDKRGAVLANLGAAYLALGELSEACSSYEAALEEPDYATPYKALQGMAATYLERGRVEEAAGAYRRAALDGANPDPGKALVNLGLCFMALDRPQDAVDAYKAALGFDSYQGRGRALANLGQAYHALGAESDAVRSFEKATQLHSHELSPAAAAAYQEAKAAIQPTHETVDGWVTGEMPRVEPMTQAPSGWDEAALADLDASDGSQVPAGPEAVYVQHADGAAAALGFGDEQAVSDFFTRSEEEMLQKDREARRAERASGRGFSKRLVTIVIGIVVVIAVLGAAYAMGFGWPTQEATVNGMFVAYSKGEPVDEYWVAVPEQDVEREMAKVPPIESFTIDSVDRGSSASTAQVTVAPKDGAEMTYTVTLVREGVGWRVSGIDYSWSSTGG
jgi:tetratricopeptide (TPR) repeat protein